MVTVAICRLAGLSGVKDFDGLLGKQGAAKKGLLKNTAVASRAGDIRRITCTHIGDGQPITLNMQVQIHAPAQALPPQQPAAMHSCNA